MWSFLGIALALFAQTLQFNTQIENSLLNKMHSNASQAIINPTPFKAPITDRLTEIQPTPTQNQAHEQIAFKAQPSPTQTNNNEANDQAINNRSNKVIEAIAPQAIERSMALDPCTSSTCPSPTPKPTRSIEPTKMPSPSITPIPTPFATAIPLPTIINEPPRCPSIPPHLTRENSERLDSMKPIHCLD